MIQSLVLIISLRLQSYPASAQSFCVVRKNCQLQGLQLDFSWRLRKNSVVLQAQCAITMKNLPFDTDIQKQIIIFIGIQASGKSTFYKRMLAPLGYGHINLDTLHTRNNEQNAIEEFYKQEKSFVVDNTNPELTDRQRYIPYARRQGYEIIGIFFQSIVRDCIRRNEMREKSVPTKAIPCTQNKLQLPSYNEGFDKLYFVKIVEDDFEITPWKE